MTPQELRRKYIDFFVKKGHVEIKSSSLIPENDPTVLFTTAGMHPLVPFLMGEEHPSGKRLVNVQKCIRTQDIDEVGDETHLTFFEMLGNWSLGDYFKQEAITWSFEFLTKELEIPLEKLAVSVFAGDKDAPFDEEAFNIWKGLGISAKRIAKLSKKDNWWGPAGKTGPCGPDTEMFFWVGAQKAPENFDPEDKNWVEIWNDVFMQYFKNEQGAYQVSKQQNVDTGMGLERTLAVLTGKKSAYETELFTNIFAKITELATQPDLIISKRIIADHLRAAVFMLAERIGPSNVDQGYVLRRLLRRAIRHGRKLGIAGSFSHKLAAVVIADYREAYPELSQHKDFIIEQLVQEEEKFSKTLEKGLKEFEKALENLGFPIVFEVGNDESKKKAFEDNEKTKNIMPGTTAFHLYDTYGFPIELTQELARERGVEVDLEGFEEAFEAHQELSRQGAEKKFKGGLQDHSEETTALHTATHLLHAALRQVLGEHVEQRGSNITAERLRFDFSHPDKMTAEQIAEVEKLVNEAIEKDLPVTCETMTVEQAKAKGAMGLFESKYGDQVKVYCVEGFSKEICGGPHVEHTGQLGHFKIKKEESSSAGIRRIKAVLEK